MHCRGRGKLTRFGTERLTGAGPRSQRGLESPGAEVGRCSLKDEGDRQGDKHGPLSTWGRRFLSFSYFTLTFLLLRVRRPSVVSLAFLRLLFSRFEDDRAGAGEGCFEAVFFGLFFWRFLASVGTSTLWIHISGFRGGFVLQPRDRGGGRCGPVTCVFQLFRRAHAHTFKSTRTGAAAVEQGGRARNRRLGKGKKASSGYPCRRR